MITAFIRLFADFLHPTSPGGAEEPTLRSGAISSFPKFGFDVPFDRTFGALSLSKRLGAAVQQWRQSSNGKGGVKVLPITYFTQY